MKVHQTMSLQLLKLLFQPTVLNNGCIATQPTMLNHQLSTKDIAIKTH